MTAPTDRFAVARAANSARRRERIEEFRRLTRDEGLPIGAACARLRVCLATGSDYEQELIAATGISAQAARQKLYRQRRAEGHNKTTAAALVGVTRRTVTNWERAEVADAS